MNIAFRVDSSHTMGSGHVMRCLVLAKELRARGANIHFICRDYPGNIISTVANAFFCVSVLEHTEEKGFIEGDDYASWLGVSQDFDAEQSLIAIEGESIDWLVVDHYSLDSRWHSVLRDHVKKICVIDDLANRTYDCDLLLDSNYAHFPEDRYSKRTPSACSLLLGPAYALISDQYRYIRRYLRPKDGAIKSILIYFGGTDQHNMTGLCLKALSEQEFSNISLNVVIGPMNPHIDWLNDFAANLSNIRLHTALADLSELICEADLGIGASGVTTWERMCLGLPSIVITIAENQRPTADALSIDKYITYLGAYGDATAAQISKSVTEKMFSKEALVDEAERSKLLVDGNGLFRVAESIYPTPLNRVVLQHIDGRLIPSIMKIDSDEGSTSKETTQHLIQFKIDDFVLGDVFFCKEYDVIRTSYSFDQLATTRGWHPWMLSQAIRELNKKSTQVNSSRVKTKEKCLWNNYIYSSSEKPLEQEGAGTSRLKIAILSSADSWINEYIADLMAKWLGSGFEVLWVHDKSDLLPGDLCFYIGCEQIVGKNVRSQFKHNLVVHESDLPHGRGWSPLTWQILEGSNSISIVLFEATESVDAGKIYLKDSLLFTGLELIEELREVQAVATIKMCQRFVDDYPALVIDGIEQVGDPTFYEKRTPSDSQINKSRSIESLFPLLRVADYERYPVCFDIKGARFRIKVEAL